MFELLIALVIMCSVVGDSRRSLPLPVPILIRSRHPESWFFMKFLFGKLGNIGVQCSINWLVVSTPLKNISQIGSFPQVGMKIKII